jgi:hypothetical protein
LASKEGWIDERHFGGLLTACIFMKMSVVGIKNFQESSIFSTFLTFAYSWVSYLADSYLTLNSQLKHYLLWNIFPSICPLYLVPSLESHEQFLFFRIRITIWNILLILLSGFHTRI